MSVYRTIGPTLVIFLSRGYIRAFYRLIYFHAPVLKGSRDRTEKDSLHFFTDCNQHQYSASLIYGILVRYRKLSGHLFGKSFSFG